MSVERWHHTPLGGPRDDAARERRVATGLFLVTCASVFLVHLLGWQGRVDLDSVPRAALFTGALMGILVAHEAGHWWAARRAGFRLSWPWFLPAPILVGTLGAIIRIRERPGDRSALLSMGAAGPLAGLVMVVVVLGIRAALGATPPPSDWVLHRPLLWWVVGWPLGHVAPPTPGDPLGFAAWVGCLVTAMNLLPFGQLDGGHVLGAVFPARRGASTWATTALLLVAGLMWWGWAAWAATLHLMGAGTPLMARDETTLPGTDRRIALLAALAWLLCVTPVPFS